MKEIIGVDDGLSGFRIHSLKREALLFDRIAILGLKDYIQSMYKLPHPEPLLASEFEWLFEQGIIFETSIARIPELESNKEYMQTFLSMLDKLDRYKDLFNRLTQYIDHGDGSYEVIKSEKPITPEEGLLMNFLQQEFASLRTRVVSFQIVASLQCEAYSLWQIPEIKPNLNSPLESADVIHMVLPRFPFPDDKTPWGKIIEFRNNIDNKRRYVALRRWMHKIVRDEVTINEAQLELEDLLNQYEEAMRVYRIKYVHDSLETILTVTAELLENLVKIKWGNMVKNLFEFKRMHVNLLECELTAPGREISYIIKAQDMFNS